MDLGDRNLGGHIMGLESNGTELTGGMANPNAAVVLVDGPQR